MWNQATELEIIMREALISNNLFFDEQVYTKKNDGGIYIFDFVVYGDFVKVIVECDGPHHDTPIRIYLDSIRDLWSIQNSFQEVLRFSRYDLRTNIDGCISTIKKSLSELDNSLSNDEERFKRISEEKKHIRSKKNSYFYEGKRSESKYVGKKVVIQDKQKPLVKKKPLVKMERNINSYIPKIKLDTTKKLKEIPIELELKSTELETYELLKSLPKQEKLLLWSLIKNANMGHIVIYHGKLNDLKFLAELKLISINTFYRANNSEYSLFVLPHAPNLVRILKRRSRERK